MHKEAPVLNNYIRRGKPLVKANKIINPTLIKEKTAFKILKLAF